MGIQRVRRVSIIPLMNERLYWREHWKKETIPAPNSFARRAFKRFGRQNKTLLDLGCGDGRDSLYFARKGLHVTALDFSETGIRALKANNKNIRCLVGDIRKMRFKPGSFDIVYAHLSLHYFDDRMTSRIFEMLFRTLKKKGLLFVKCKSTDDALFGKGRKVAENVYCKGHTRHFFSKEYMKGLLQGFKILSIRKTSSVYHAYRSSYIEAIARKSNRDRKKGS